MTIGIILISVIFMLLGMLVQWRLKSKFKEYSQVPTSTGMSGKEIAQKMLRDNGIYDVQVISVPGALSDHYNPVNKTVNLSAEVYEGRTVAAAAVSAHECGHAVQHNTAFQLCRSAARFLNGLLLPVLVLWALVGAIQLYCWQVLFYLRLLLCFLLLLYP